MEGKKRPPGFWPSLRRGEANIKNLIFCEILEEKTWFFAILYSWVEKTFFCEKWKKDENDIDPPLRLKAKLEIFDIYQNYKTLIFMFFSFFPRKFILWTAYFTFSTFWKLYFHATLYPKSHINEFGKHRKSKISLNGGSGKTWFCIKKKVLYMAKPFKK